MKFNWGTGIAVVTAAFMVMILSFVVKSFRYDSELVSEDYYQQELDYQTRMQQEERGRAEAVGLAVDYNADCLSIVYPKSGWKGEVSFFRPSDKKLDFKLPIAMDGELRQCIPLASLAPGFWHLQFTWQKDGEVYYYAKSTTVP